jgi:hypothetical protein
MYPQVKVLWLEADHLPSSNAEVRNASCYASAPSFALMLWCLIKQRDNFTFTEELNIMRSIFVSFPLSHNVDEN